MVGTVTELGEGSLVVRNNSRTTVTVPEAVQLKMTGLTGKIDVGDTVSITGTEDSDTAVIADMITMRS